MDEGVDRVVLQKLQIKPGSDGDQSPKRPSYKRCSVVTLVNAFELLIASYNQSCFGLLESTVLVELVGIYPHTVEDLVAPYG